MQRTIATRKNNKVLSKLLTAATPKQRARIIAASKQHDRITNPQLARDRGY